MPTRFLHGLLLGLMLACCGLLPQAQGGEPQEQTVKPRTFLVLGDSITAASEYVNFIETWMLINTPAPHPKFIALGLSSETASGLSEPHHPFPRPNVHERLGRTLKAVKPDLVIACYGMNDGIYHPFSEERFKAYQQGIETLIEQSLEAGATKVILLTPPPYAGKLSPQPEPEDGKDFGYKTPFKNYDEVLQKYAEWILTLKETPRVEVVDVRTPLVKHMRESYGKDPIHPNRNGHWYMAAEVLSHLSPAKLEEFPSLEEYLSDPKHQLFGQVLKLVAERREIYDKALLQEIGHKRPGGSSKYTVEEAREKIAAINQKIEESLKNNPR